MYLHVAMLGRFSISVLTDSHITCLFNRLGLLMARRRACAGRDAWTAIEHSLSLFSVWRTVRTCCIIELYWSKVIVKYSVYGMVLSWLTSKNPTDRELARSYVTAIESRQFLYAHRCTSLLIHARTNCIIINVLTVWKVLSVFSAIF